MNKQTQEALKMAIKALLTGHHHTDLCNEALNACKEALEQPVQEPVAWYWNNFKGNEPHADVKRGSPKLDHLFGEPIPLYTHPHQWQGLTEDEIKILLASVGWIFPDSIKTTDSDYSLKAVLEAYKKIISAIRAIEQALKEKNHGSS